MRILRPWLLLVLMAALSACGGDEAIPSPSPSPPPPPYTGPSHGTGILRDNAHVLPAEQAEGSMLTLDTLTVRKPQSRRFSPGEIVILDAHEGRLLEITSVSETEDTITYHYTLASLAQAFEKLDVSFSGKLTPEELGATIDTGDPSLEVTWINREEPSSESGTRTSQQVTVETNVLQIKYKNLAGQGGSGFELDGTSSFLLNPDFSLRLEPVDGQELPSLEMSAVISPALKTSVSVASLNGGQISYVLGPPPIEFPAIRFPITVMVGVIPVPVPFWVKPVLTFSAAVNGTASSKFKTTRTVGVKGALGFRRTVARGLEPVADYSTTDESVSDVETEFGINVTPKVELHFQIYSVAGPTIDMGVQFGLTGKSTMGGSPPVAGVEVAAAAKLVANAGLKASVNFANVPIDAVKKLLGNVSVEYTPFSLKLVDWTILEAKSFYPYLEVSLPELGLYAYADPSASGFSSLTAKIKKAIPADVMKDGALTASVKFHRNGCFKPDLSGEFTRDEDGKLKPACQSSRLPQEEVTRSASLPISQLESGQAQDLTFQFQTPIPMSATDVYLQLVHQGNFGSDAHGMRIVVGTRDLSEPTFVGVANATDMYQLPLFPGYGFFTPQEIKDNITQAPYKIVDYNRNGVYDYWPTDYDVDGEDYYVEMSIQGPQKVTRIATIPVLAPGRYSRVALLADTQPLKVQYLLNGRYNSSRADFRLMPKKAQVNPQRCNPLGPPCTFVEDEVITGYMMRNLHHYWTLHVVNGFDPMWMDFEDIPVSQEPDADKPVPASYPSSTLVMEPRVLSHSDELTGFVSLSPDSFSVPLIQVNQLETPPGY